MPSQHNEQSYRSEQKMLKTQILASIKVVLFNEKI